MMTSNFRLLAGLTSLDSNLWLSHFCASGPAGILASRLMLFGSLLSGRQPSGRGGHVVFAQPAQYRDRNRNVAGKNQDRRPLRQTLWQAMAEADFDSERLKHRVNAMAQMGA